MEKNKTMSFYIQIGAAVLTMIVVGMLPPIGQITPYGMKVLGIFLGCIIGWGFGHQIVISIFALILLSLSGGGSLGAIFSAAYGNQSLLMVVFGLIFCFGMEQTGIMQWVANFVLSRKFATKGPWFISLAFWLSCCLCSAVITNCLPVIILMWSMFYNIVEKVQVPRSSKWVQITMIMMCVVGYTGSVIMPYAAWNLLCYSMAMSVVPGLQVNLFAHCTLVLVCNVFIITLIFVVSKFVLGKDVNFNVSTDVIDVEATKMDKRSKWGLFYLAVLAIAMFLPNVLDATVPGISILKTLTTAGIFAVGSLLLCITYVDGKPLMEPLQAVKSLPWPLYYLLGTALYLASLLTAQDVGISATLMVALKSMLGNMGTVTVIMLFVVFGCVVTNAVNNVVCVNIFIPIGATLLMTLGGGTVAVSILTSLLAVVLYLGLMVPSGSVVGALMHGNSEWLQAKNIYLYAGIGCIIVTIVCFVVGIPLGMVLFN
ncbi:MAG: hypothetical protein IJC12_05690 [Peptococcaceae bacterium]|nr:hypothetical protein [Peptococcaceae bacterium]